MKVNQIRNNTKIHKMPKYNQMFIYSYFCILILTLLGFTGACLQSELMIVICSVLLVLTLIFHFVVGCLKQK